MKRNETFIQACRKQPVEYVPVWYMRQAGRYQAEYREIRKRHSLIDICHNPELCAKVTALPVEQLNVDAAILFSDIMVPLGPMGVEYDIVSNRGPVLAQPVRTKSDVEKLRAVDPEDSLAFVLETIRILNRQLHVPLIGFTGAPFTLASYMVEGEPSRNYIRTKALMYQSPDVWRRLMDKLGDMIVTYLRAQVQAGAAAVQIFDSWVGALSPQDFAQYVFPTMKRIFHELKDLDVPKIYFGVGTGELLPLWKNLDVDVIGLDWRVSIADGRKRTQGRFAYQGNLDPVALMAPWEEIRERAKQIIDQGIEQPGFIFNLGHGVFPQVDPDTLKRLTAFVHEYSREALLSRRKYHAHG